MPYAKRPFLRPLLVWSIAIPYLALAVSLGFLISPFAGRQKAFWLLAPGWIRQVAAAFGLRRRIIGWEDLPESLRTPGNPAIFIANHSSFFDPPLLISTLPCQPVFIVKRELAWVPFLGWLIWLARFIFVDRRNSMKALSSMKRAAERIREGQNIAVFPEGTRSHSGQPRPFKRGMFTLAKEAGVPVVPMAILGGTQALPVGEWRVKPSDYAIRIGKPLFPQDYPNAQALAEAAENAVHWLMRAE